MHGRLSSLLAVTRHASVSFRELHFDRLGALHTSYGEVDDVVMLDGGMVVRRLSSDDVAVGDNPMRFVCRLYGGVEDPKRSLKCTRPHQLFAFAVSPAMWRPALCLRSLVFFSLPCWGTPDSCPLPQCARLMRPTPLVGPTNQRRVHLGGSPE